MRRRVFVPSMQGHDERSGEDSPAWNRSGPDRFRMSKMRLCDQCAQHPGRASLVNSGRKRRVPDRQACALYRRVTGIDVGLRVTLPPCFLVEPRRGWPRLAGIFFIRARYETMRAYRLYPMSRDGHIAGDLNPTSSADE